ncbi:DUF131 domain-containing protein [Candidatus Woesearchaeota archaeon]|nr:DUF131 domain-containing protein [Candidatus Woesearchaeota archaeon]
MMEKLVHAGSIVIFAGVLLVIIGTIASMRHKENRPKVAVGGFIGFIPFGFGNDKRMVYIALALSCALVLIWVCLVFQR